MKPTKIAIFASICGFLFCSPFVGMAQMSDRGEEVNSIPTDNFQEEEFIKKESVDRSVFYNNVVFNFEGSIVPDASKVALDLIAAELLKDYDVKVRIKGHTCDQGSDQINLHYSKQRALTIRDYLLSKGVKENQMVIEAVMDKEPLVPNDSEENRKINRRVEIELIN